MSLSRRIVDRVDSLGHLPDDVVVTARLHLLDALGVGLAASASAVGGHYRKFAERRAGGGPATMLGCAAGGSAADAALVNGGLIHSLEYDDTHTASIVHGSAVLVPAALAAAEATGATGRDFLKTYSVWYEIMIRIGASAPGSFQRRGFQFTSVGGALCAAGIAANLRGLDQDASVAAIGIALSQASGVFEFLSNGSTVKSLHPGWAAHSGVMAAELAEAGMTGPETAIEGTHGLFRAFAGDADASARLEKQLETLGTEWELRRAAFKFHPCCHYLHPFIEAAGKLADQGVTVDAIETLELCAPEGAAGIICEPFADKQAASGHAARWSLPVVVAMQFVDGEVTLESFEKAADPVVQALAARCSWQPIAPCAFPQRFEAEIRCRTKDGQLRSVRIDDVYGNASRPASAEAVIDKFLANASRRMAPEAARLLAETVQTIDGEADLSRLSQNLRNIS